MTVRWRSEAIAFLGFLERQKNLVRRYWAWEVVWLVYSMVSVLSIGFLASGLGQLGGRPVEQDRPDVAVHRDRLAQAEVGRAVQRAGALVVETRRVGRAERLPNRFGKRG